MTLDVVTGSDLFAIVVYKNAINILQSAIDICLFVSPLLIDFIFTQNKLMANLFMM